MSSTQQLLLGEGAGGGAVANYIEDVFSTFLYTGNGNGQGIDNGIDLSTKGGLVWIKDRTQPAAHILTDTARGPRAELSSNQDSAQYTTPSGTDLTSFNTTGFSLGSNWSGVNSTNKTYVSWTFREQPKFFDIVTYTGVSGANPQNISHNLGATPGFIIIKRYSDAGDNWICYHTSLGNTQGIILNSTGTPITSSGLWNNTSPTSTQFTIGTSSAVNGTGSFIAYLFAHDAGGFGASGTDNVITCGSVTLNGSGNGDINLGFEPQWVLFKKTSGADDWRIWDTMRGFYAISPAIDSTANPLAPNNTNVENSGYFNPAFVTSTGFSIRSFSPSATYVYVAIRRGPMKVPTSGTSVFAPVATTANGATAVISNFPVDLSIIKARATAYNWWWSDRLRGNQYAAYLGISRFSFSNTTDSEQVYTDTTPGVMMAFNGGIIDYAVLPSGYSGLYYNFRRAPSFFDIVCFTGDGTSNRSINHNLGVVPELFFTKRRSSGGSGDVNWGVYSKDRPSADYNLILNSDTGWYNAGTGGWFGTGTLSATLFPAGRASGNFGNLSGAYYVTYLFASCPGVSKVGSYTGTGVDTTIDCGFVDGARLVLIKETSSADNWAIFDSARGYATSSDPYLALNAADAESTGNWLLFRSEGFGVRSSSYVGGSLNVLGQTYIFLAIA